MRRVRALGAATPNAGTHNQHPLPGVGSRNRILAPLVLVVNQTSPSSAKGKKMIDRTKKANEPHWKKPWIDRKTGKRKGGFWYFNHNGKRQTLTKYGAPARKTRGYQQALRARDRFLSEVLLQVSHFQTLSRARFCRVCLIFWNSGLESGS